MYMKYIIWLTTAVNLPSSFYFGRLLKPPELDKKNVTYFYCINRCCDSFSGVRRFEEELFAQKRMGQFVLCWPDNTGNNFLSG